MTQNCANVAGDATNWLFQSTGLAWGGGWAGLAGRWCSHCTYTILLSLTQRWRPTGLSHEMNGRNLFKEIIKFFPFGLLLSCPAPAKLGHPGARPARRTEMISKPAKQARNAGKKLRIIIDWRNFLTCRISNFSITQYKIIIYAGRERAATHLLAMLVHQLAAGRDTNKQTRRAGETY